MIYHNINLWGKKNLKCNCQSGENDQINDMPFHITAAQGTLKVSFT